MDVLMIAAVLVSLAACVLVFLFIMFLAGSVTGRLKKEVFRYIKVYNEELGEREPGVTEETIAADEEENAATAVSIAEENLAIPYIAKSSATQKKDFFSDYLSIRAAFREDMLKVIRSIPEQNADDKKERHLVKRMLDKLTFEIVYKISCLLSEDQLSVLQTVFLADEYSYLENYRENRTGEFSVAEFQAFLNCRRKELDDTIYVHVREPEFYDANQLGNKVVLCKDEELLEGFQIIQGTKLYDFGVRNAELIR